MHSKDRPVIYIHPITGDYKVPMRNDEPMPERYKIQGYERREFTSYHEHSAFCKAKGLVNHLVEGIKKGDDALGTNKWGY